MLPECFNYSSNSLPLDDSEIFVDNDDSNLLDTDVDSSDDSLHMELSASFKNLQLDQTLSPVVKNPTNSRIAKNALNLTYNVPKVLNSTFSSPHNEDFSANLEETINSQNNSNEEQNSSIESEKIEEIYSHVGGSAEKLSFRKDTCSHLEEMNVRDGCAANLSNLDDTLITDDESSSPSVNTSVNIMADNEEESVAALEQRSEELEDETGGEIENNSDENENQKGKKGQNKPIAKLKTIETASKPHHCYNTRYRLKEMDDQQLDEDSTVNSDAPDELVKSVNKRKKNSEVKTKLLKQPAPQPKKDLKNNDNIPVRRSERLKKKSTRRKS